MHKKVYGKRCAAGVGEELSRCPHGAVEGSEYCIDHKPWTHSEVPETYTPKPVLVEEQSGNPKDKVGSSKVPMNMLPEAAIVHGSLAMLEGALKYGKKNYRHYPVKASVYLDAIERHKEKYASGEDADKTTRVKHLGSIIAGASILLDAELHGTLIDDRDYSDKVSGMIDQTAEIVQHLQSIYGTDTRLLEDRNNA